MESLKPKTITARIAGPAKRLAELDALRCFLSWWVVLDHLLLFSGYRYETLPSFVRILERGDYAVDVFIILSGFVIAKLLTEKQEGYGLFISRRFLRLFPVFVITLFLSIVFRPLSGWILAAGWPANPVTLREAHANWVSETQFFWAHLLTHLSMLHGLVPDYVLPGSAVAFLAPAWSISLEWQYYLVAPFLALVGRKGGPAGWLALAISSILATFLFGAAMQSLFPVPSFLPQKLLLFLVGASSYWMAIELAGKHRDLPWLILFFIAPAILWFTLSIPLAIWTGTFAIIISNSETKGFSRLRSLISLRWIQRLGEISYSTYLSHVPCIWLAQALVLAIVPKTARGPMFLALLLAVPPLTIFVSELLYHFVEAPGIQFGRRMTRRS